MPINVKVTGLEQLQNVGKLAARSKDIFYADLLTETERFAIDAVAIAKRDYLSGPKPDKIEVGKGALRASITYRAIQNGDIFSASIGSNLVYAPIQEFGGQTKPNVTDRMRKFMWFMFFKTGDEKFKRLALTKKNQLTINIPPRPYLRPALEDALPDFQANIFRLLGKLKFAEGA